MLCCEVILNFWNPNASNFSVVLASMSNAIRVSKWLSKLLSVSKMGQFDSLILKNEEKYHGKRASYQAKRCELSNCKMAKVSSFFSPHKKESELENWQVAKLWP